MRSLYSYIVEGKMVTFDMPKFNQCVILAGGPGSGKGYATDKHILADFRTYNVDDLKKLYIKMQHNGRLWDRHEYDLSKAEDTYQLHARVRDKQWKGKQRDIFWNSRENNGRLPNVLFDMVTDDPDDIREIVEYAKPLGYEVTIVWVVCNLDSAREGNQARERRVPDEVLVKGHRGAYQCMTDLLSNKYPDINENIDNFWVVLSAGAGRDFSSVYKNNIATKVKRNGFNFDSSIKVFVDDFLSNQMPKKR